VISVFILHKVLIMCCTEICKMCPYLSWFLNVAGVFAVQISPC